MASPRWSPTSASILEDRSARWTSSPSAGRRCTTSRLRAGDREALEHLRGLLLENGPDRYPSPFTALGLVPLELVHARERLIREADLLLVALRPDVALSPAERPGWSASRHSHRGTGCLCSSANRRRPPGAG